MVAADAKLLWWNTNVETVTGLDYETVAHMSALEFFPESEVRQVAAAIHKAAETGYATVTAPFRTSKGFVLYEFNAVPGMDRAGQVLGVVGAGRDIADHFALTESLRQAKEAAEAANQAKQEQLEELDLVYQMTPVGLGLIGRDYRIIRVNERLAAISGVPIHEHVGHILRQIIPGLASVIESNVDRVYMSGQPVLNFERTLAPPNDPTNERHWLESYYPVGSAHGNPRYVGFVLQDMTETKKVEVELRRAKAAADEANRAKQELVEELEPVYRMTPLGMALMDKTYRVLRINEGLAAISGHAFMLLTGYAPEEAFGQNPRVLKSGQQSATSYENLWRTILADKPWHAEIVNRRKDGILYTEEMTITPVRVDSTEITNFIAIKQDVTERMQMEETLRTRDATLSAISSATIDAIIMIDNDANIMFWNQAAERILGYSNSEVLGRNLHKLIASQRFRAEFEKGLAGFKLTGEGSAIGKIVQLVAVHHDGHEFPVELSLTAVSLAGKWCAVGFLRDITERKETEKALVASERFAHSTLDALSAHIAILDEKGTILATNKVWREFALANEAKSDVGVGANYLDVCDRATGPCGQEAAVEAILIALSKKAAVVEGSSTQARNKKRLPATRSFRILLAEDQPVAVRMLENRGHSVVIANNGQEALEALTREPFDVILMDMQMPDIDGFEATRAIRLHEKDTTRHLPIVAMTAYAIKGDRERCLASGCDDYLAKPIDSMSLYAMVEKWDGSLAQHHERQPEPATKSPTSVPDHQVWDKSSALERVDSDEAFLSELVELFVAHYPNLLAELNAAIQQRNAVAIAKAAHSLQGNLGSLGATEWYNQVRLLEAKANSGDFDAIDRISAQLVQPLASFIETLTSFLNDRK